MDREKKKRGREVEVKKHSEKKAKKREIIGIDDTNYDIFKVSDTFRPLELGVFEFPWLNETLYSESEEWKYNEFSTSLIDDTSSATGINFSENELFQTSPALKEFDGSDNKLEDESWPEGNDGDGVDCIWSSVLNQPLFTGSVKGF